VLAASRKFAREKFGAQYRYAMVLHTDQQHPHVHLVVKAESEEGRRLYIDKEKLRLWREDFARFMKEQGIAANATPRFACGRSKGKARDAIYRAQHHGSSTVVRERVTDVANHLGQTGSLRDLAHERLVESLKALIRVWLEVASTLGVQGETALAGEVRQFASQLRRVLTDRERVAIALVQNIELTRRRDTTRN
jgi:MobA/VirD2-like, nuclease domain